MPPATKAAFQAHPSHRPLNSLINHSQHLHRNIRPERVIDGRAVLHLRSDHKDDALIPRISFSLVTPSHISPGLLIPYRLRNPVCEP